MGRNARQKRKYSFLLIFVCLLYWSGLYEYLLTTSYSYYTHWGPSEVLPILGLNNPNVASPVNYSFIINNNKCKRKMNILLVTKSTVGNYESRQAIRQTWGNESNYIDANVRTIFMLGKSIEPSVQNLVESESAVFGDLVQGDFIDTYFNTTLKVLMTFKWVTQNCPSDYYVLVDDDYYISPKNLQRLFRSPLHYPKESQYAYEMDYLYAGYVFRKAIPSRLYFSKWYISLQEYRYSAWPPYIAGGFNVLSHKSLESLYYACLYTDYFKLDDVFLGMAAKIAGLSLLHYNEIHRYKKFYYMNSYKNVIASHGYSDPSELIDVWNKEFRAEYD